MPEATKRPPGDRMIVRKLWVTWWILRSIALKLGGNPFALFLNSIKKYLAHDVMF